MRLGLFCVTEIAASWDCFWVAIASIIGYFEVAQETVCKIRPPKIVPQCNSRHYRPSLSSASSKWPKRYRKGLVTAQLHLMAFADDISQRVSVFCKNESDCSLAGSQCFSRLIYCRYWLQVGSFSQKPLLFVGLISK